MTASDLPGIVEKIDNILQEERPKPEQVVGDFANEKKQLQELLPFLDSWHIAEIIANWKRK